MKCQTELTSEHVDLKRRTSGNTDKQCTRTAKYRYNGKCYCAGHLGEILIAENIRVEAI